MTSTLGMMFPGQGSQSVGMLAELAAAHPVVVETFAEASEALGEDLWTLTRDGPAEVLDRTENTQPAMLTASVAVFRAWRAAGGPAPAMVCGHSLGEYSALVAAGALPLPDAVRLVRARGIAMQAAVSPGQGSVAAILGLDDEQVEASCAAAAGSAVVAPANYNAPGQVVIAGDAAAVDRAIEACREAGARRAMPLAVSVPVHCTLMAPASAALRDAIAAAALSMPGCPVFHNVDAQPAPDLEALRARLLDQLCSPVRWSDCVRAMRAAGAQRLLECGPGKVLTGLLKRIDRDLEGGALGDRSGFDAALAIVLEAA